MIRNEITTDAIADQTVQWSIIGFGIHTPQTHSSNVRNPGAKLIPYNPEIQVVSRDRASAYASAAAEAAPQAIQVADRFHVCKNLTEATQLLLARCQAEIAAVANNTEDPVQNDNGKPVISIEEWRPKEPAHVEKARLARRAGREARYEQVISGHKQGLTTKEIASQLGMSQRTVQKWLAALSFPEAKKRRKKSSSFDEFAPYVLKRWQEGEHNGLIMRDYRKKLNRSRSIWDRVAMEQKL